MYITYVYYCLYIGNNIALGVFYKNIRICKYLQITAHIWVSLMSLNF